MGFPVFDTFGWYNTSINSTTEDFNIYGIFTPVTMSLVPADSRIYQNLVSWFYANASNLVNHQFSAVCYYFARHLQSKLRQQEKQVVPLGLIHSAQAGTIIEAWLSKAAQDSCDYRVCQNYDGYVSQGSFLGEWFTNTNMFACNASIMQANSQPESLFNAMVIPWTNYSIKGALWYQGESSGGNPGNIMSNLGYACMLPRLMQNWRDYWGYSTGDNNIPFGIVSLSGYCGGQGNCFLQRDYSQFYNMNGPKDTYGIGIYHPSYQPVAWLRWAQTANIGRVPNVLMNNAFIAMSYDYPDPIYNNINGPPKFQWGPEHPRYKYYLGNRLSLGAMAIVYGNNNIPFIGPVFDSCNVDYNNKMLNIQYNNDLLRGEYVTYNNSLGYGFEVSTSNSFNGWFSVNVSSVSNNGQKMNIDLSNVLNSNLMNYITGIRYAWRDNPCCKSAYSIYNANISAHYGCEERKCSVYSQPSKLPLIPFISKIAPNGNCLFG